MIAALDSGAVFLAVALLAIGTVAIVVIIVVAANEWHVNRKRHDAFDQLREPPMPPLVQLPDRRHLHVVLDEVDQIFPDRAA